MDRSERDRRAAAARRTVTELAQRDVVGVAVTWVDISGITRVKAVPVTRLEHAAAWGIGMSPVFDTFLLDDSTVIGGYAGGPVGDLRLMPDLDRLTVLSTDREWAWAPADRYDQDGGGYPLDSRLLLRRQLADMNGLTFKAAFEVEWCLSDGGGDEFVPASQGPAYSMARLMEQSTYLRDVVEALEAQRLDVEQVHPEYASGQYEISVAANDPLGAADDFVLVRETIRQVSADRGMRATFSPKVLVDGVGNGAHVHLSAWRDGGNLMSGGEGRYGLRPEGEAFAAGVLAHLPALLAVGAPAVASYLRLIPSHWAGAYACWGWENREAAIRLVTGAAGERDQAANIEIKCFDAAANPYLLSAALLAAGKSGIDEGLTLPEPVDVDPDSLHPDVRAARGISPLPQSLDEAVAAFEADPVIRRAFGDALVDTVATVRRGEIALFDGAKQEEIVARTRWRH